MSAAAKTACDPFIPLLAGVLDGELAESEQASVLAHVDACAACKARLDDQARIASLLVAHAPAPDFAPEQLQAFERGLDARLATARPAVARPTLLARIRPGPAFAAAATFIIAVGIVRAIEVVPAHVALAFPRHHLPERPYEDPRVPSSAALAAPSAQALAAIASSSATRALTPAQRAALERDGLVQVPATDARPTDFLASLPEGTRPLVTVDAALLAWGGATARASLAVEHERIVPELRITLDALGRALEDLAPGLRTSELRRASDLARGIVAVAADLDGLEPRVSGELRERVLLDAGALWLGRGRVTSAVLGRELDGAAYKPRGPLASEPKHFETVQWLGDASLALDPAHADEARAAALIVLGLARARLEDGGHALAVWDDLDSSVELLHGPQDDLGAFELLAALRNAFGVDAVPAELAEMQAVANVATGARAIAERRAWALGREASREPRFTLLGGTRAVEQAVVGELVAPALPGRTRPTSLDLLAALGSKPARTIASLEGAPGYDRALDRVSAALDAVREPPRALALAGSGLERAKLFALAGLVGQPMTMVKESEAAESRVLLASLAALNGTAPAPDASEGAIDPKAPLPLVEPAPVLYARLAHTASRIAAGLERGAGPEATKACASLRRAAELFSGLASASLDELAGRAFAPASEQALRAFYPASLALAPERAVSVEDVHALRLPSGELEILERASGPIDRVWEIVRVPGGLALAVGPALSAREVVVRDQRLAPDALEQGPRPAEPAWATHVVGR